MNNELKQIKKIYGEEMMHLCRDLFPTILEQEGCLIEILTKYIAPSHSVAKDIIRNRFVSDFKCFVYGCIESEEEEYPDLNKTPFELMKEAGYTLYECKNEDDIQSFKHYYRHDEELCTFHGGRLDRCYVFFAVKDGADKLDRNRFLIPERDDEYGTSVISIQFARNGVNTISIKNRYNHTVNNPDATFNNKLENIIPGLTKSFEKSYKLKLDCPSGANGFFFLYDLRYLRACDGRFYRYNIEHDGIYYCENNIVVLANHGRIIDTYAREKERYLVIDNYLLDLKEKTITTNFCSTSKSNNDIVDSFPKTINKVGTIRKIEITKKGKNRLIVFTFDEDKEVKIEINQNNTIVGYENKYVEVINDDFMYFNKALNWISLPNVVTIKKWFLSHNRCLDKLSLPKVKTIGNYFVHHNRQLVSISLPEVREIGNGFLWENTNMQHLSLPKLERLGEDCMRYNRKISVVNLPEVREIGGNFLCEDESLKIIRVPKIESMGILCFNENLLYKLIRLKIKATNFIKKEITNNRKK